MKDATPRKGAALDDPDRLTSLADLALMDSPAEEVFDRAVRLATRVLGTEVGLLSLVDGTRQFFKAQKGLPEPYASARGTPLSHSFCQHVVTSGAPLIVADAREDDRFKTNLAIRDLDVIAYLGVPVRNGKGDVLGSFCAIQSSPRDWTDEDRAVLNDIAAGIESELALRALAIDQKAQVSRQRALRQRLDLALKSGAMGTYDLDLTTGVADWDPQLYAIWGLPEDIENPFDAAIGKLHPDDIPAHEAAFAAAMDPKGDRLYAVEARVIRATPTDYTWTYSTGLVTFDGETPVRIVGTVTDISERKRAEEHAQLLAQELNHRVKNLFAITNGIVGITARESATPAEMATALRARIVSLSAAHDLVRPAITRDQNTAAETDLTTLAKTILQPHVHGPEQVQIEGPHIPLSPEQASSFALVLHELATNAAKYGAFVGRDGRLDLRWQVLDETLDLRWAETTAAPINAEKSDSGFGTTLIDLTVKRQMHGDYQLDWQADGLVCTIRLPWT